ncbi:MAG: glycosyltransferase [Candidatus Aenigmatarchaeota archaeon]
MIKKIGRKYYSGTKIYATELYEGLKKDKSLDVILIAAPENSVWDKSNFLFFVYGLYKLLNLLLSRKVDGFHALSHVYSPYFPILKLFGVKVFVTILDVPEAPLNQSRYFDKGIIDIVLNKLYGFFIRFADYYISISEMNKEKLISIGIKPNRITVVHLAAEEKFRPIEGLRDFKNPIIGFMGGRISKKTLINVVKLKRVFKNILKKYSNCKFIISGVDKYNRIQDIMMKEREIQYKKFIPVEDVGYFYNSLYLYVHVSDYEGFGLSLIESQVCGTPVIILKDAQIPKEVSETCIKVKSFDDLEKKIEFLLNNIDLWRKISERGLKYCKRFVWSKTVKKTIKAYKKLLT